MQARMAKIVKLNVVVRMVRVAMPKPVFVSAHPDGQELFVPIAAFPERTVKIAQSYVSALTMAVAIISRASVFVRQAILVTSASTPAHTICMD